MSTVTYAESVGKEPIDWHERLKSLSLIDSVTLEKWKAESCSWVTCACGNQCDVIPRNDGVPDDPELMVLGAKFHTYICHRKAGYAEYTLKQIEERSAELIKQIQSK
jgi:hypothetical protein